MPDISVLVIDDEPSVLKAVKAVLVKENMAVTCADNCAKALSCLLQEPYDLILLDIIMPGQDGFSFLRELRSRQIYTPVILLSGQEADASQVKGLGLGADDYMIKPFNKSVLVSKIRAIIRRTSQYAATAPCLSAEIKRGPFTVHPDSQTVYKNDQEISLSAKEFSLLCFLIENPKRTLTKQEIFAKVWKCDVPDDNTILVYIKRLRDKIEDSPASPTHIRTVWGQGYQFYY